MSAPPVASLASYTAPTAAATTSLSLFVDRAVRAASANHVSGSVATSQLTYADENALAFYLGSKKEKLVVEHVGLICYDINGSVVDRVIPGAAFSPILDGTQWRNTPATDEEVAGCGRGKLVLSRFLDYSGIADVVILVNGVAVYRGRITAPGVEYYDDSLALLEAVEYQLEGWSAYASDVYAYEVEYEAQEVSVMIKALATLLAAKTPITYDATRVEATSYTANKQAFDGVTIASALNTLTDLVGSYVWGVDTEGTFFFAARESTPQKHYWLEQHQVEISKLEIDPSNIKNAITVDGTEIESGSVTRVQVEDAASIAAYRRREAKFNYPFAPAVFSATFPGVTGSNTVTDAANAQNTNLSNYASMSAGINDYYEFAFAANASYFTITQGEPGDTGNGLCVDVEFWDQTAAELLWSDAAASNVLSITFTPRAATTYRLIAKSTPVGGGDWLLRSVVAGVGGTSDLTKYANSQLAALKDPVIAGDMQLEPGCWESPEHQLRVTDYLGVSTVYDQMSITNTLKRGLERVAEIGQGQLRLAKAIADQQRRIDVETARAQKAEQDLATQITTEVADQASTTEDDYTAAIAAAEARSSQQDFHSYTSGTLSASQELMHVQFAREVTFRGGTSSGVSEAITAATSSATLDIKKQTVAGGSTTTVGSIVFAASGTVATVTIDGDAGTGGDQDAVFSAGDILTITGPGTPDATLAGITIALIGEWT